MVAETPLRQQTMASLRNTPASREKGNGSRYPARYAVSLDVPRKFLEKFRLGCAATDCRTFSIQKLARTVMVLLRPQWLLVLCFQVSTLFFPFILCEGSEEDGMTPLAQLC
jgi:hypothetical protein